MCNKQSNCSANYSRFENEGKDGERIYGPYWRRVNCSSNKWSFSKGAFKGFSSYREKTNSIQDEKKPLLDKTDDFLYLSFQ